VTFTLQTDPVARSLQRVLSYQKIVVWNTASPVVVIRRMGPLVKSWHEVMSRKDTRVDDCDRRRDHG